MDAFSLKQLNEANDKLLKKMTREEIPCGDIPIKEYESFLKSLHPKSMDHHQLDIHVPRP